MVRAYNGFEKYMFLSYSHKDKDFIEKILETLNNLGCRIWYDEGIYPSDEWAETIAERIVSSSLVLVVISNNSMQSVNVKKEISFAISKNIPLVVFYKDKVQLSLGLQMQLDMYQAVIGYNNPSLAINELAEKLPKTIFEEKDKNFTQSELDFQKKLILAYYKNNLHLTPTANDINNNFETGHAVAEIILNYILKELSIKEDEQETLKIKALKEIIKNNFASISLIQRKFLIGFNKAAKILDEFIEKGYIERVDDKNFSIKYKVVITKEQFKKMYPQEEI